VASGGNVCADRNQRIPNYHTSEFERGEYCPVQAEQLRHRPASLRQSGDNITTTERSVHRCGCRYGTQIRRRHDTPLRHIGDNLSVNKFSSRQGIQHNGRTITVAGTGANVWNRTGGTSRQAAHDLYTDRVRRSALRIFPRWKLMSEVQRLPAAFYSGQFHTDKRYVRSGYIRSQHYGSLAIGSGTTLSCVRQPFAGTYGSGTPSMSAGSTVEYAQTGSTMQTSPTPISVSGGTVTGIIDGDDRRCVHYSVSSIHLIIQRHSHVQRRRIALLTAER